MWPSSPRIIRGDAADVDVQELYNFQSVSQIDGNSQICHFGSVYQSVLCLHVSAIHVIIAAIIHCYQGFYEIVKMTNSGAAGQNAQELYNFSGVSQSGRE